MFQTTMDKKHPTIGKSKFLYYLLCIIIIESISSTDRLDVNCYGNQLGQESSKNTKRTPSWKTIEQLTSQQKLRTLGANSQYIPSSIPTKGRKAGVAPNVYPTVPPRTARLVPTRDSMNMPTEIRSVIS